MEKEGLLVIMIGLTDGGSGGVFGQGLRTTSGVMEEVALLPAERKKGLC